MLQKNRKACKVESEEWMLGRPFLKIHSVRRLSDGEVFVLGDDFTWNKGINHGRIERFEISKNNGNMLAVHFSGGVGINNISKAKKKIFTTDQRNEVLSIIKDYLSENEH